MVAAVTAAVAAAVAALVALVRRIAGGSRTLAGVVVHQPTDDTHIDPRGAVRSIQGADIVAPAAVVEEIWDPLHLERLARTYWAYLSHVTLGLIRVHYTSGERFVCLLGRPLVLLRFQAPEYEMNDERGVVRWRIERGVLVAPRGRGGDGYLEIEVCRRPLPDGQVNVHVEVEVANFYPMIARSFTRFVYTNTQSRIHVIVTHGFLRRLARRDLDTSVTGRFAGPPSADAAPEPRRAAERVGG